MVRFIDRPFMMPIADKYKDMGTVVMGKVEAGEAKKGQTLMVLPNKVKYILHIIDFISFYVATFLILSILCQQSIVVVDQLWSDEEEVSCVGPGENVKIKLKGIEEEDISSGFVLCDPNNTCKTGRTFDAQVRSYKTSSVYLDTSPILISLLTI